MGDSYLMGANSNAWDSCLAQRHTSTCKRTKSTGLSISAHELSLAIQAFGNLNSVALDTSTHDSSSTIKASKVLSEDHSFCKRLKPCTQAPLFVNGSIPMRQARPGKIDCQPSREGSCLMDANSNAWDSCLAQRCTSTCKRAKSNGSSISAHELSLVMQALGFRAHGLPLTRGSNFHGQGSSHKKAAGPCWELRPYRAHGLSGACLTADWRRPCREPRSRRGGTAGWRRGREGSQGR